MCPGERTWRGQVVEKVRELLHTDPSKFGLRVTISRDDRLSGSSTLKQASS